MTSREVDIEIFMNIEGGVVEGVSKQMHGQAGGIRALRPGVATGITITRSDDSAFVSY